MTNEHGACWNRSGCFVSTGTGIELVPAPISFEELVEVTRLSIGFAKLAEGPSEAQSGL